MTQAIRCSWTLVLALGGCGGADSSFNPDGSGSGSGSGNPGGSGSGYFSDLAFSLDDGTSGSLNFSGAESRVQDEYGFYISANRNGFSFEVGEGGPEARGWLVNVPLSLSEATDSGGELSWTFPIREFALLQVARPEIARFELVGGSARLTRCASREEVERDRSAAIFELQIAGEVEETRDGTRTGTLNGTIRGPLVQGSGWTCPES